MMAKQLLGWLAGFVLCAVTSVQAAEKITIATGVDPAASIFYIARDAGILKKHGFDVDLRTGATAGSTISLVINGEAIASHAAAFAGLVNHLTDPDIVAVAQTTTLDRWYAVVSTNKIKDVKDLKGKKIALSLGTASETLWTAILKKEGMSASDFEVVNLAPPEMVAALTRGDIAAYVAWEPWVSRTTVSFKDTKVLQDGRGLITDGTFIYMSRKWINAHKDAAVRFGRAMLEANDFIVSKPAETKKIVGAFLNLSPELMDEMYPKLTYAFKLDPESYQITKDAVDILTDRGRIKGKFDYNAWFDTDLIKTVKPSAQTLPNM
jgi:ABC-type nitrate/sulfonate/bicarbonate transport system substrate-binding protein